MTLLEFVSFLDANFGENFFPDFTLENVSVFIMAFALKKIVEKGENFTIDTFACPKKIKTFSAGQNIQIYLNDHYKKLKEIKVSLYKYYNVVKRQCQIAN